MKTNKELEVKVQNSTMKKHKCEICEKVFKTQNIFENHFSNLHANEVTKIINCNICTKTFQT